MMTDLAQTPPIPPRRSELLHLPGDYGLPVLGNMLAFLNDPLSYTRSTYEKFGPVSRAYVLFEPVINLMSAEGNEFVLLDREHNFSAHWGWQPVIGQLFPRGLMLRDGDDHRYHRRLMQSAFRKEALIEYLQRMNPAIQKTIAEWNDQPGFKFYPQIKRLTLQMAAEVFLGLELSAEVDQVNHDFAQLVEASSSIVRLRTPLLKWGRGLAARERLVALLQKLIPARRAGQGQDLFSQLCHATDEHGASYSDDEIVDHLIFLMMAAHDTTTSALTTISFALAKQPQWQERLRADYAALGTTAVQYADLEKLETTGWVLREALRQYPPLGSIRRQSVRECQFQGHRIPAHTGVVVYPLLTQRLAQWWNEPERFDPERFSPERAEHRRHPFAWTPFGGGAHMCIGLHFAEMQVKAVLFQLLQRYRLQVPDGYEMPYQLAPIAKPRDGLPLELKLLSS